MFWPNFKSWNFQFADKCLIWGFWTLLCVTVLSSVSRGWVWGFQKLNFNQLYWGTKLRKWRFVSSQSLWQMHVSKFFCCGAGAAGDEKFRSNIFVRCFATEFIVFCSLIDHQIPRQLLRSWVGIWAHSFPNPTFSLHPFPTNILIPFSIPRVNSPPTTVETKTKLGRK